MKEQEDEQSSFNEYSVQNNLFYSASSKLAPKKRVICSPTRTTTDTFHKVPSRDYLSTFLIEDEGSKSSSFQAHAMTDNSKRAERVRFNNIEKSNDYQSCSPKEERQSISLRDIKTRGKIKIRVNSQLKENQSPSSPQDKQIINISTTLQSNQDWKVRSSSMPKHKAVVSNLESVRKAQTPKKHHESFSFLNSMGSTQYVSNNSFLKGSNFFLPTQVNIDFLRYNNNNSQSSAQKQQQFNYEHDDQPKVINRQLSFNTPVKSSTTPQLTKLHFKPQSESHNNQNILSSRNKNNIVASPKEECCLLEQILSLPEAPLLGPEKGSGRDNIRARLKLRFKEEEDGPPNKSDIVNKNVINNNNNTINNNNRIINLSQRNITLPEQSHRLEKQQSSGALKHTNINLIINSKNNTNKNESSPQSLYKPLLPSQHCSFKQMLQYSSQFQVEKHIPNFKKSVLATRLGFLPNFFALNKNGKHHLNGKASTEGNEHNNFEEDEEDSNNSNDLSPSSPTKKEPHSNVTSHIPVHHKKETSSKIYFPPQAIENQPIKEEGTASLKKIPSKLLHIQSQQSTQLTTSELKDIKLKEQQNSEIKQLEKGQLSKQQSQSKGILISEPNTGTSQEKSPTKPVFMGQMKAFSFAQKLIHKKEVSKQMQQVQVSIDKILSNCVQMAQLPKIYHVKSYQFLYDLWSKFPDIRSILIDQEKQIVQFPLTATSKDLLENHFKFEKLKIIYSLPLQTDKSTINYEYLLERYLLKELNILGTIMEEYIIKAKQQLLHSLENQIMTQQKTINQLERKIDNDVLQFHIGSSTMGFKKEYAANTKQFLDSGTFIITKRVENIAAAETKLGNFNSISLNQKFMGDFIQKIYENIRKNKIECNHHFPSIKVKDKKGNTDSE